MRSLPLLTSAAAAGTLALALAPAVDAAKTTLTITGRGFGHGVGMSAYGAYGLARHGSEYRQILARYYQHTKLGHVHGRHVKVLLGSGLAAVRFNKANAACGVHLNPRDAYQFVAGGNGVALTNKVGRTLKSCGPTGAASGGPIHVLNRGTYRGRIVARRSGGIDLSNRVTLEGYVEGVVPNEFPASWPQPALRTEAVAARTFAIASPGHGSFDVYDDTRSQVYGGKGTETPATDHAVHASKGKVVTYRGRPVTTYYSSTSGGHTEDVQFAFIGATPEPWLLGVRDPYDKLSPYHTWRRTLPAGTMTSELSGLFSGRLKGIEVLKHGVSPRIVYARVVGSRGSSRVSGPTLEGRLGLMSTWERFRRVGGEVKTSPSVEPAGRAVPGGGVAPAGARRPR
jgi:stage II sporulation protein D